jgi:pilus assembly protein Flp/PilA
MRKMIEISRRLRSNDEGAAMVEYGLLVALIALVCIGAVTLIGSDLNIIFGKVGTALTKAIPAS